MGYKRVVERNDCVNCENLNKAGQTKVVTRRIQVSNEMCRHHHHAIMGL